MIDLHVHSTFSDGSLTPESLVSEAAKLGVSAMALTDHDTVDGVERFMAACSACGTVTGVAGVEISADVDCGTLHMLGYFVDTENAALCDVLNRIRNGREIRNEEILERLNGLGLRLSHEDVAAFAGEQVVGRPHIAQAMLKKGYVRSFREAFDKYLAKGEPAYADRFRLSAEESIRAIRGAGGVAVLAHPFTLELDPAGLRDYVSQLKSVGLGGVEVYYSEHSESQMRTYLALVRNLGLAAAGGTDFHGEINPGIKLGLGFGNLRVPDELLEGLRCAAAAASPDPA